MHELTKSIGNAKIDSEVLELGEIITSWLWEERVGPLIRENGKSEPEGIISDYIDLISQLSSKGMRDRHKARVKVLDHLIAEMS